jgi:ornithine cyclodeaminase/alanine dehydrogenase-like protein (mu-crystallin family)
MGSQNRSILYLEEKDVVAAGLSMKEVIGAVEAVYSRHAMGRVLMPPKRGVDISDIEQDWKTGATSMFGFDGGTGLAGVKWIGENKMNSDERAMPNCIATILLNDGRSFWPKAILQGLWITGMRTGAETAVGLKYLANKKVHDGGGTIAIIGCGAQAKYQAMAVLETLKPAQMILFDVKTESMDRLSGEIASMKPAGGSKVRKAKSSEEAVRESDVIITVTSTAGAPIVRAEYLQKGALVCAIGSRQEMSLDAVNLAAKIIVDNIEQILHAGQLGKWVTNGFFNERKISAEIGEVVAGKKRGRENDQEIIVYIPGGMATLDIAVGSLVIELAEKKNLGLKLAY